MKIKVGLVNGTVHMVESNAPNVDGFIFGLKAGRGEYMNTLDGDIVAVDSVVSIREIPDAEVKP